MRHGREITCAGAARGVMMLPCMSVRPLLLLALSACSLYDGGDDPEDEDGGTTWPTCDTPDPSGCSSWSECITSPSNPDYGQCGGTMYRCEGGEWVIDGYCEPWPIEIEGDLTLQQTISFTEGDCPALVPRDPLVLTANTDRGTLTAAEPVVIVSGEIIPNYRDANGELTLGDDWSGVAVTASYVIYLRWDGVINGGGTATVDGCTAGLDITGSFEPLWRP